MGNMSAKLNTVNFEKEFNEESAYRKRIARGAFAKKNGSKSTKCTLPSDALTRKQWEAKNSEVFSVNMKTIMTWSQFNHLDENLQTTYLKYLFTNGGDVNTIADMFNLVGSPDVEGDTNVTSGMIQNKCQELKIDGSEIVITNDSKDFTKWICKQIDKKEEKSKVEEKEPKKRTPNTLSSEQKAFATPSAFYTNLINYMTVHVSNIVRDYDKVQKDTVIILNRLQRKSKSEIHTNLQNIHLIINRVDFIKWLGINPRFSNLFQQELIANGIPLVFIENARDSFMVEFYQKDKIPEGYKDSRIPVFAIDINMIPEPYRHDIFVILCKRYSVNTMNKLFHYNKEEKTQMKKLTTTYVDPSEDVEEMPSYSLMNTIKNSGLNIQSLDVQIHGMVNLKGTKEEIIEQLTKYIDFLNLNEIEIKF